MLILYYWPGASSVIPHITLEEIGVPYERELINLAKGEHKREPYLSINPRGKVPALSIHGDVLTENVAILTYLAKRFPDAHSCRETWGKNLDAYRQWPGSRAPFIRPSRISSGRNALRVRPALKLM